MAGSVNKIRESKGAAERVETLLADIRNLILTARKAAVRSVDILQVMTCFEIGRRIVEYEQQGSVSFNSPDGVWAIGGTRKNIDNV